MSRTYYPNSVKKRTNLSINEELLQEAKSMGINLSSSAEAGIQNALSKRKEALWKEQNEEALKSSNKFVDEKGLPLGKFRHF